MKEIRPKVFLFENVRGLVTAKGATGEPGEVLKGLLALFQDAGYSCRVKLLKLVMQLTQPDTRCRICLHERQGVSRYVR